MDDEAICMLRERIARLETRCDAADKALVLVADSFKVQIRALAGLLLIAIAIAGLWMKGR